MAFDSKSGYYIFELTLCYRHQGKIHHAPPCVIQADDQEEAEEKALIYIDDLGIEEDIWVEEVSDPYPIEDYDEDFDDAGRGPVPVLNRMTEEELQEFLSGGPL